MNHDQSQEANVLLSTPFPTEFGPGVCSAVNTCLRIETKVKVTLITDRATAPIAASLAHELEARGYRGNAFLVENYAERPLTQMPKPFLEDMESSDVSFFALLVQRNELHSRIQMTDVVNRRHMKHAHMVNITSQIMCDGMRADFNLVDIAFGDAYENHTGAPWKSTTHIDVVGLRFNIGVGGADGEEQIMHAGTFTIER